ncbi:amidohydrolase family protein [Amycolatopsis magusensis]|uniref:amidohydrolase family protein n=1 Tax=Amycolatopsis magusensis TaxID=882444 RepID=UPI003C2EB75E
MRSLLAGGSVFDAASGEVSRADVVLDGDRIVSVGIDLDGDEAVDCTGGLLLPGFIDCHTHVCMSQTLGDPFGLPRTARALSAVPVLRTLLGLGITTVRDA